MSPTWPKQSQPNVGVIIPSGGRGERAGEGPPKQFRAIGGVPMLLRSIRVFLSLDEVAEIVIPLPKEFLRAPPPWLAAILSERVHTVNGGSTRAESVHNGFMALSSSRSVILIHDAARPFVGSDVIAHVISKAASGISAIAAAPVRDTLKRTDSRGTIIETVERAWMWQAQTPQGFPREVLTRSYDEALQGSETLSVTDEANLVERAGFAVHVVEDATTNFKVTTREDFALANALAQA